MTTKTDQIREALRERYPGGIPHGRQRDLAKEFGVSRQLVQQVALSLDLHAIPGRRRLRAIIEQRIAELERSDSPDDAAERELLRGVLAKADRLAGVTK